MRTPTDSYASTCPRAPTSPSTHQLQALNATAPIALRERIGEGTGKQLERRIMAMRQRPGTDLETRTVFAVIRDTAARSRALTADARRYENELAELVRSLDDTLLDEPGIVNRPGVGGDFWPWISEDEVDAQSESSWVWWRPWRFVIGPGSCRPGG